MLSDIVEYILAFLDNWFFWIGLAMLIGDLLEKFIPEVKQWLERCAPRWLLLGLAGIFFFSAGFHTWREEHAKVMAQAVYMIAEPPALVDNNTNIRIPIGQPLQADIYWKVWGQSPARGIGSYSICYIRKDYSDATQDEVITDFKNRWGDIIKNYESEKSNMPDSFPNSGEKNYKTCKPENVNDKISVGIRDDLKVNQEVAFVVGAERFYDGTGEQESHTCWYMENNPQAPADFTAIAFHKCHTYTTQVSH
jgi:hypothetical protein